MGLECLRQTQEEKRRYITTGGRPWSAEAIGQGTHSYKKLEEAQSPFFLRAFRAGEALLINRFQTSGLQDFDRIHVCALSH